MTPARRPRRGGRAGVLAVSLFLHGGLLTLAARLAAPPPSPDVSKSPPTLQLFLEPRLRAEGAVMRAPAGPPPSGARGSPRPAPAPTGALGPEAAQEKDAGTGVSPRGFVAPPGAAGAGMSGPDADALGAVRSALRAGIGCDTTAAAPHSAEERARCAQRFGANARAGPAFIDTIPAEKRAYYDAVQAAFQAARDPAHPLMRDANGEVRPWGHGPGLGCGMKFGGPPPKPDHRGFVEKIKGDGGILADIGPLKCGIILPQGSLTPELGIAPP